AGLAAPVLPAENARADLSAHRAVAGRARRTAPAVRTETSGAGDGLAACLDLLRRLGCEIGQNAVGAGALEAEQSFHHGALAVDPAVARRARNHRVFAGHLVDEGRHPEGVLYAADDVEIGHAGLDHDHVGAFGDVEFDLA